MLKNLSGKTISKELLRKDKLCIVRKIYSLLKDKSKYIIMSDEEVYKMLDKEIDQRIKFIFKDPDTVILTYKYLIGYLLANRILLLKEQDNSITDVMNYITEHLEEYYDVDEILDIFNINDFYESGKVYIKQ